MPGRPVCDLSFNLALTLEGHCYGEMLSCHSPWPTHCTHTHDGVVRYEAGHAPQVCLATSLVAAHVDECQEARGATADLRRG